MKGVGQAHAEVAERYFALFVNRLAYTRQSHKPGTNGKHYYYRPKQDRRLSLQTIREHLNGQLTIGIYALNPTTQRSKWVAIAGVRRDFVGLEQRRREAANCCGRAYTKRKLLAASVLIDNPSVAGRSSWRKADCGG
jgi:hypothetical protein